MYKKTMLLLVSVQYACASVELTISYEANTYITQKAVQLHKQCHKRARGGFFSEFNNLLANLIHYERDRIASVYVDWTHPLFPYKDNPADNGWDLYFEQVVTYPLEIAQSNKIKTVYNHHDHELHNYKCTCIWTRYDAYLPYRLFVHDKIKKHIRIKKHVLDSVDHFYQQHMQDNLCIGVQVRSAHAHQKEAPFGHQPLQEYITEIDKLITQAGTQQNVKIFLATDSKKIVKQFKMIYKEQLVYLKTYRANNDKDHTQEAQEDIKNYHKLKPGYNGGLGALMDCLLLARCDHFIHITSNLAQAVTFFNPYIDSIFLPRNAHYIPCERYGDKKIRNLYLNPF